jgi:SAM-dependent methyltransferase
VTATRTLRSVKQAVPVPIKQAVKAGRRTVYYDPIAYLRLAAYKRDLASRFGPGFVYEVHPDDEMYRFLREFWSWKFHVEPMRTPADALRSYLVTGDRNLCDLETVLADQGRELSRTASFLEFACGYGRFTRFLVRGLDPTRITVSDISRPAVDFERRTFGVRGFYSTESAANLHHEECYEVVFVASLFSHLSIAHWTPWLVRLYGLVAPGGLLIFSAHGNYTRDIVFGPGYRDQLETAADGFTFLRTNETGGRLSTGYYGNTFVTSEFVRSQMHDHGLGSLVHEYPDSLWGTQDCYVVAKPLSG